jgi:uncharacterized membrane protein
MPSALDGAATPQRLRALHDAKLLTDDAYERALELASAPRPAREHASLAARVALLLGAALCFAAVVFFIAHNWHGMTRWQRFGALEAGLVAFGVAAVRARAELTRQIALTLCAAMFGPLLAVYGQTYQTGADPYELFLTWALLAAPLAALARFMPLWLAVWGLLNVSVDLWCHQLSPFGTDPWHYAVVLQASVNVIGLVAYELATRRTRWLGARVSWPARVLAVAALLPALPTACWYVADSFWHAGAWGIVATVIVSALCVALAVLYRSDRFMKTTAAFGACGLVTAGAAHALRSWLEHDTGWAWALLGLFVVLEVTLAAAWIRSTRTQPRQTEVTP